MITIYALTDPRTAVVRYVGQSRDPARRLVQHIRTHSGGSWRNPWVRWLGDLRALRLRPILLVLETCDDPAATAAEQRWIAHYRQAGADLLNKVWNTQEAP